MTGPVLTPLAAALPATVPFVGPETQERARGRPFQARIGANESGFGPAPEVKEAISRAGADAWMYGDPENYDLRMALSAQLGTPFEAIMPGEGIDGLLGYLVRLLVSDGAPVVTSAGAYPTFNYHVAGFGGALHTVPYREDAEDPEALIAKAKEVGARLIYFANPDNPMGSCHPADRVSSMIATVPNGCLLLLDEAYAEFAPEGTLPPLDPTDRRVIRMRTFSKAHGLAGLRVGYALGHPEIIGAFNKVRNHFGMSRVSQAAALASLSAGDHLARTIANVATSRDRLASVARANGLTPLPSATNFVTIDCGQDGHFARAVLRNLIEMDVFVRMPGVAPLDRCIRVSCGPESDMRVFEAALPRALDRATDMHPSTG